MGKACIPHLGLPRSGNGTRGILTWPVSSEDLGPSCYPEYPELISIFTVINELASVSMDTVGMSVVLPYFESRSTTRNR